jgi:hypothetical protein
MRRAEPASLRDNRLCRAVSVYALVVLTAAGLSLAPRPALALSEIQRQDTPSTTTDSDTRSDQQIEEQTLPPIDQVPLPDSATPRTDQPGEATPEGEPKDSARPEIEPDEPIPPVLYDLQQLPEPVRRLHDRLLEACKSGDIEKLRPFLETGESGTQLSFGGVDGDPIAFLKELSGDKEGAEILAILEDVLESGYVHLDADTANDLYVWPYFFAVPLDKLTARQRVELFKIVTAGDYEEMKPYGSYTFYRVGITPDGRWSFFVEGD